MGNHFICYTVFFAFLFASCNDVEDRHNPINKKVTESQNETESKIIGKWGGLGEESPVWDIRKDSIYYFQHSKAYAYKILNKNMHINFGNTSTILKNINVKSDTLFFIDDVGLLIKGYRFR